MPWRAARGAQCQPKHAQCKWWWVCNHARDKMHGRRSAAAVRAWHASISYQTCMLANHKVRVHMHMQVPRTAGMPHEHLGQANFWPASTRPPPPYACAARVWRNLPPPPRTSGWKYGSTPPGRASASAVRGVARASDGEPPDASSKSGPAAASEPSTSRVRGVRPALPGGLSSTALPFRALPLPLSALSCATGSAGGA